MSPDRIPAKANMNVAAGWETSVPILSINMELALLLQHCRLPTLSDTWMTPHRQCGGMLGFSFVVIFLHLSAFECMATVSFEWLHGFGYVTWASTKKVALWVKFQFWVNIPVTTGSQSIIVLSYCVFFTKWAINWFTDCSRRLLSFSGIFTLESLATFDICHQNLHWYGVGGGVGFYCENFRNCFWKKRTDNDLWYHATGLMSAAANYIQPSYCTVGPSLDPLPSRPPGQRNNCDKMSWWERKNVILVSIATWLAFLMPVCAAHKSPDMHTHTHTGREGEHYLTYLNIREKSLFDMIVHVHTRCIVA